MRKEEKDGESACAPVKLKVQLTEMTGRDGPGSPALALQWRSEKKIHPVEMKGQVQHTAVSWSYLGKQ
jgi:hypothetical protein